MIGTLLLPPELTVFSWNLIFSSLSLAAMLCIVMFEVLFNFTLVSSNLKLFGLASIATNFEQISATGMAIEPR